MKMYGYMLFETPNGVILIIAEGKQKVKMSVLEELKITPRLQAEGVTYKNGYFLFSKPAAVYIKNDSAFGITFVYTLDEKNIAMICSEIASNENFMAEFKKLLETISLLPKDAEVVKVIHMLGQMGEINWQQVELEIIKIVKDNYPELWERIYNNLDQKQKEIITLLLN